MIGKYSKGDVVICNNDEKMVLNSNAYDDLGHLCYETTDGRYLHEDNISRLFIPARELTVSDRVQLVLARVEILKLKANDHDWSCYVPDDVKVQLEQELLNIDGLLK